VRTRSNALLKISFALEDHAATHVFLEGPAQCVYTGQLANS
jgi:hypothetical protein